MSVPDLAFGIFCGVRKRNKNLMCPNPRDFYPVRWRNKTLKCAQTLTLRILGVFRVQCCTAPEYHGLKELDSSVIENSDINFFPFGSFACNQRITLLPYSYDLDREPLLSYSLLYG
jgi:hypothetical protein